MHPLEFAVNNLVTLRRGGLQNSSKTIEECGCRQMVKIPCINLR